MSELAVSEEVARILVALGLIAIALEALVPGGVAGFIGASTALLGLYSLGILSAVWAIATLIAFTAGLIAFAIPALRARRYPKVTGVETVAGSIARANTDISPEGTVAFKGVYWKARSDTPVTVGEKVRITGVDGLVLLVEPVTEEGEA
ncbi:MAG: NfeD family protein [Actinomycetota bacterium]